jgi:hypothetical protein
VASSKAELEQVRKKQKERKAEHDKSKKTNNKKKYIKTRPERHGTVAWDRIMRPVADAAEEGGAERRSGR